jgi:galactokinase
VSAEVAAFAPGRVNLIGEHTDYNQGLALPFAIERGITVRATAIPDRRVEAIALDLRSKDAFELDQPARAPGWRAFARGAVAGLQGAGITLGGARLEISGTVPRDAGLSSSAALEVALVLALLALAGETKPDRRELAKLCSRIESEWLGARTGLLDQLASLYGAPRAALRIDFHSLEIGQVGLELEGHRLVTLDSGERRANATSAYNERRAECARACELLGVPSLREASIEMTARLPDPLARRARHVLECNLRVEAAVAALKRRDMSELGRLLDASHASLRDLYEVSTPAAEAAVERLRAAGALGARIMGGGFGGHVLGLLPPEAVAPPDALEVGPGPGARLVSG